MKKMMALALAGCVAMSLAGCGDDDDDNAGAAGTTGAAGNNGVGTGPGSALKCESSGKNAYETYGSAFGAVNDAIIANVTSEITANGDTNLGPSFSNSLKGGQLKNNPESFKQNLADFLVFAYGGPNNYKGRSMEAAHTGLAITQAQYDYFITNVVVKALTDKGVPMGDVTSCFAGPVTDASFVATIVGK